jgi:hypothetical protein
MPLGDGNRFSNLGSNHFAGVMVDYNTMLSLHGVEVNISRNNLTTVGARNIFGTPVMDNQATPQPYQPQTLNAMVILADLDQQIEWTEAGARVKEVAELIAAPGTLLADDELTFYGHTYRIMGEIRTVIGGNIPLEVCTAAREVD